jgi:hypothetical protein
MVTTNELFLNQNSSLDSISKVILGVVITAAFIGYIIYETHTDFMRMRALGAIVIFIGIGLLISGENFNVN